MIYELIHTSWPKGLKSGTSGYTPVAYTQGMPASYRTLCESLSGYPHLYPLGHPHYDFNPVVYSHFRFRVSGKIVSILSRVSPAGVDYSGRENKLAHHIVIEPPLERFRCGPAFAMLEGDLFFHQWNEDPHLLPVDRIDLPGLPIQDERYHARTWQRLFGDAGGAGALAQSALDRPRQPSFILFDPLNDLSRNGPEIIYPRASHLNPPSMIGEGKSEYETTNPDSPLPFMERGAKDNGSSFATRVTLHLIFEAMMLLPPENRWNITFSTYFVTKPMDSDCLWRCLVDTGDNKEQGLMERHPESMVIDLSSTRKKEFALRGENGASLPWSEKETRRDLEASARTGALPLWAIEALRRADGDEGSKYSENVAQFGSDSPNADEMTFPVSEEHQSSISDGPMDLAPFHEASQGRGELKQGDQISSLSPSRKKWLLSSKKNILILIWGGGVILFMALMWGKLERVWNPPHTTVPLQTVTEGKDEKSILETEGDGKVLVREDALVISMGDEDGIGDGDGVTAAPPIDSIEGQDVTKDYGMKRSERGLAKKIPETVLAFYRSGIRLEGMETTKDFAGLTCRSMDVQGQEMAIGIEKPITMDTRNHDLVVRRAERKKIEPEDRIGTLSPGKLTLYRPEKISALLFQSGEDGKRAHTTLLWVSPFKIDKSSLTLNLLSSQSMEKEDADGNDKSVDSSIRLVQEGKWVIDSGYPDMLRHFLMIFYDDRMGDKRSNEESFRLTGVADVVIWGETTRSISSPVEGSLERLPPRKGERWPEWLVDFTFEMVMEQESRETEDEKKEIDTVDDLKMKIQKIILSIQDDSSEAIPVFVVY